MTHRAVKSSAIRSIGYDQGTHKMQVQFTNGGLHEFSGVPPEVHGRFAGAKSHGQHFQAYIRGKYESKKL